MISTYKNVGMIRMKTDEFDSMSSFQQKRYILLQYCPDLDGYRFKPKNSDDYQHGRLLELQLNTVNQSCRFVQGTQLESDKTNELMIFSNYAPNDPGIYASHTSLKPILGFELLQFCQKNRNAIRWSSPHKLDDFIEFLGRLFEAFYHTDNYGTRLQKDKLISEQQEAYPDEFDCKPDDFKKEYKKRLDDYLKTTLKDLVTERQAYSLKIDGVFLHESEYADCYIDALFYYIFGKQFYESKHIGHCHICSKQATLAEDVSLKQKFYGTTNSLYFDGLSSSASKYAFSMCQECYQEVIVGTQFSSTQLKTSLLGLSTIVLPELPFIPKDPSDTINPVYLKSIVHLIRTHSGSDRSAYLDILKKLQKKLSDFSLLFYNKPSATSQEFVILSMIRGIKLKSLIAKTEHLGNTVSKYRIGAIMGSNRELSFEGFRYLIIPSKESHPQIKVTEYSRLNKVILQHLGTYLHDRQYNYKQLICQFIDIFNRKHNHLKASESSYFLNLSPFLMNLYLHHLQHFNQLEGVPQMEGKTTTTDLHKEEIKQYFMNNTPVYDGNYHAQGLFIMGIYIANVENEQRKKKINSTLLNRLNLRGIPVQKVKVVMALVDDMRQIWKPYQEPLLDAYYRECMQDIEHSKLMPEEVVFHILSGRAYSSYLSILHAKTEDKKDQTEGESND